MQYASLPLNRLAMHAFCRSALFLLLFVTSATVLARDDAHAKPNVILIVADDLGYGDLGCYGQTKILTPRLDQMAREGLRLTQFYCGSPVCAPSRCVLLTGKHSGHAAIRDNREIKPEGQFPLPESEVTLAELFKKQGYVTSAIGKWGLGASDSSGSPSSQGFDSFFGYLCQRHAHNHYPDWLWKNDAKLDLFDEQSTKKLAVPSEDPLFHAFVKFGRSYAGDLFEQEALAFIRKQKDDPFFLFLPITTPHLALQVPDESLREYEDKWEDPPYAGGEGYLPNPAPRATYAAMVSRMDRMIGRILDELEAQEITKETLVIFTSDNGPAPKNVGGANSEFFNSSGSLRGLKGTAYEGGIRVPCIIRWPTHVKPECQSSEPLAFYDLLPTLCEIANLDLPPGIDGTSFGPLLLGAGKQIAHPFLYWEYAGGTGYQALRMGKWKAIRSKLKKGDVSIELYDLDVDPGESKNLAADYPEVVEQATRWMTREHAKSLDFPLPGMDGS